MARTDITPVKRVRDSSIDEPAGTTIDAGLVTAGVRIVAPDFRTLSISVNNTALADKVITIVGGSNPPALKASQGNLAITVVTTGTERIGPLTSARFAQADGSLWVNFAAGTTGTIKAVQG